MDFRLSCCLRRFKTPRRFIYNFKNTDFDQHFAKTYLNLLFLMTLLQIPTSTLRGRTGVARSSVDIIRKHAPKTRVWDVSSPPWFDSEVRHLQKQKETSRRRAARTNLPSHKAKFLDLSCKCKNLIARKTQRVRQRACTYTKLKPKALLVLLSCQFQDQLGSRLGLLQ